jgi:Ca-activated chloride channel homolog
MSDPEFDLDNLAKLPIPQPRPIAIAAAKRAALEAFDITTQKSFAPTKGLEVSHRLSRIATKLWSFTMNTRLLSGTALATLLIAPIAGITAYQLMQNHNATPMLVGDAGLKKDMAAEKLGDNKITILPAATPAMPIEMARKRNDGADAEKAKSEVDSMASTDVLVESASQNGGSAAQISQDKLTDTPAAAAPAVEAFGRMAQADQAVGLAAPEAVMLPAPMPEAPMVERESRDKFPEAKSNSVVAVATQPVSTFSVDVDTSGYSSLRRMLNQGVLPEHDAVRLEEMVNYFPYSYAGPEKAEDAFKANVTVTPTPWNQNTKLLHIGIKGYDLPIVEQKAANLVFLLDVSGSMDEPDKLPLLKASFRLLVNKLKPTDTVSIVTYAGDAGIVLEPTKASEKSKILNAIDNLQPGGSTAGEAGINAAYKLAEQAFVKDGVNRIMLATDGDFNVGAASDEDLKRLVEDKRKSGVFLSVLGFGEGNYQDNLMQTLAQNGNGIAAYIDTLSEAEKVLVQEATASLFTIAKDVKIQVEFNPATVSEYRLIGYETRHLNNEDFNNDRVDAGDIGSGHTVTAVYEMTPKGALGQTNDPLRYGTDAAKPAVTDNGEYAFVKIRYKLPTEATSRLVTQPVTASNEVKDIAAAPDDVRFGIAVTAFGEKLRDEDQVSNYPYADIEALAISSRGTDAFGYRGEFLKLVRLAASLNP